MHSRKEKDCRAQGQNGHSYQTRSCKEPSHNALHEVLKQKPKGKGNMSGHTYLKICTYNTGTLKNRGSARNFDG